ncbi:MAG: hypothetical protein A2138_22510 [Deltaproteobacteria bacterium RBG_16_71_12]|nr:MAG: hypothetical protein A2138_22510 [Deltaproteobacteria bacterium RBG_16_71_12]
MTVVTDGRVTTSTMERLGASLPTGAAEGIRDQALTLVEDVVRVYGERVAAGEVGLGGSSRAASDQVTGSACPTGLLYGRIQSGKTNAMILSSALAIDNGFRVIVVLTSDNTALVQQTAARFRVLDEGPLIYASTSAAWDDDRENIARHLPRHGVVFVCSKNRAWLSSLIGVLSATGGADYPALIFDDEADQATPDTTTAARASGRSSAPAQGSTTFRLTVQNDAPTEPGESIRETLRHNVFVQVTATPYALLLQNTDSPLRPSFTRLLEPGPGYTGGESFFSAEQVTNELPPLVFVNPAETAGVRSTDQLAPDGLARSIALFLLGSSALRRRRGRPEPEGFKFLCHTSPRQADHTTFAGVIRNHVDGIFDASGARLRPEHQPAFAWAHASLQAQVRDLPALDDLLADLARRIQHRRVLIVNAAADSAEFGSAYNFLVGGNILGRGLTIDNLLVTYYLRMPRTTQMDTMLQHARMFGYRAEIMPLTRVFLPQVLAARFARITEAEAALRGLLGVDGAVQGVPVQVVGNLRPTRANVLDPNAIGGIRAGQQVYPSVPAFTDEQIGTSSARVEELLQAALGTTWDARTGDYVECSIDQIVELVRTVRTGDPDAGDWEADILTSVLGSISGRYVGRGFVFVREFQSNRNPMVSGAISSAEQSAARGMNGPVLFLFREQGDHDPWARIPFWYPTLVFPSSMANQVFNVT